MTDNERVQHQWGLITVFANLQAKCATELII